MNRHIPVDADTTGALKCLADDVLWPCENVDEYWLPIDDSEDVFADVEACAPGAHLWGPWVISTVFGAREDRFCLSCGAVEYQTLESL